MQAVVLDSEGRLLEFQARPLAVADATHAAAGLDWSRLFQDQIVTALLQRAFRDVHEAS